MTRTISMTKGGRKFVFRYPRGHEDDIVDAIVSLAEDDSCPIDWLDAATLSYQVTQYAAADCARVLKLVDEKAA
jgi:hypothetical protein